MSADEQLKFQGALEKQGKLASWSWKKYWFVLENDQLSYFREQDNTKVAKSLNKLHVCFVW